MNADPLASMRCWEITVILGGREFDIPALPAVDWWPLVSNPSVSAFLDMLGSGAEIDGMILDGLITGADLSTALTDVIEEATGRSMHKAFVLAHVAGLQWASISGRLAQRGFRWDVMPIAAALDAIYVVIIEGIPKDEDRIKFLDLLDNESLSDPGKGRAPSQRVVDEFEAMAGPRPDPVPAHGTTSDALSDSRPARTRTPSRPPRPIVRPGVPMPPPG